MKIKSEILGKTVHCNKDFECIRNKTKCCSIGWCIDKEVHFVDCSTENFCNYRMNFGDSVICTCPTRKEIYNKYGK